MGTYIVLARHALETGRFFFFVTFAAAKISFTDLEISGPMPSPSIRVTVYFPCSEIVVSASSVCGIGTSACRRVELGGEESG